MPVAWGKSAHKRSDVVTNACHSVTDRLNTLLKKGFIVQTPGVLKEFCTGHQVFQGALVCVCVCVCVCVYVVMYGMQIFFSFSSVLQ